MNKRSISIAFSRGSWVSASVLFSAICFQAVTSVVPANAKPGKKPLSQHIALKPGLPERSFLKEGYAAFSYSPEQGKPEVVFANRRDATTAELGIIVRENNQFRSAKLALENLENYGWVKSYASYDRKHIWAVADSVIEAPGWEVYVVHSEDGGRSWSMSAPIRKPYHEAGIERIRMRRNGSGELIFLHYDNPLNPVSSMKSGYYTYKTYDWGKTWSQPSFTPDILMEPDTASEFRNDNKSLSDFLQNWARP